MTPESSDWVTTHYLQVQYKRLEGGGGYVTPMAGLDRVKGGGKWALAMQPYSQQSGQKIPS
jgi:hypothetical protein